MILIATVLRSIFIITSILSGSRRAAIIVEIATYRALYPSLCLKGHSDFCSAELAQLY